MEVGNRAHPLPGVPVCGAHEWNRTIDLLLTKEVLYRLSYVSRLFQQVHYKRRGINGAGDGDRTRTISLEG